MRVCVIGPSDRKSFGGMATVINDLRNDSSFCERNEVCFYPSYIDGILLIRFLFCIFSFLKFVFIVKIKEYDLFYIHVASGGSTFRKMMYSKRIKKYDKKIAIQIHGAEYLKFYYNLPTKKKQKVSSFLNDADACFALSERWKNDFEYYVGINNCLVLNNGVRFSDFAPAITIDPSSSKNFICLGRLCYRKGTYDLIKAFSKLKEIDSEIKLILAGDGDIPQITKLITENGLQNNVFIIGWIDFSKKIKVLKQCSTLILPSYNEGLPMAILEAMACGKIIISTDVGAISEVVRNEENGLIVSPGDIDGLVNSILKCVRDTSFRTRIMINNIEKIKKSYDVEIIHSKLESYFLDILQRN